MFETEFKFPGLKALEGRGFWLESFNFKKLFSIILTTIGEKLIPRFSTLWDHWKQSLTKTSDLVNLLVIQVKTQENMFVDEHLEEGS